MALVMTNVISCPEPTTDDPTPNEIVITGISGDEVQTYLFSEGTSIYVASNSSTTIHDSTARIPLQASDKTAWIGSGTVDVCIAVGPSLYKKASVVINSTTTTVSFDEFVSVRTLIVTDLQGTIVTQIDVFPAGMTPSQGKPTAVISNVPVTPTIGVILMVPNGNWWTGTGLHDVYLQLDGSTLKKISVDFSTPQVTVSWNDFF